MGEGHSQNVRLDLTTSSYGPYFRNHVLHLCASPYTFSYFLKVHLNPKPYLSQCKKNGDFCLHILHNVLYLLG
jgi:hypothetical protein